MILYASGKRENDAESWREINPGENFAAVYLRLLISKKSATKRLAILIEPRRLGEL